MTKRLIPVHLAAWLFIPVLSAPGLLRATAQYPDLLFYDGKEYSIQSNPLEGFLKLHPEKRPQSETSCTALWRGYVASWKIEEGRLLLGEVSVPAGTGGGSGPLGMEMCSVRCEMFPGQSEIGADWFSGHLIIPVGEMVEYVHMGYASLYDRTLVLRIENGFLVGGREMNLDEFKTFRCRQFEAFKGTAEYAEIVGRLKDQQREGSAGPEDDVAIDAFLFEYCSGEYLSAIFPGAEG